MATSASTEVSSSGIDERRAQQLMERALAFAERGDLPAAVLACRQAISLAPESAQSYSILGFLLERSGDVPGAIAAYETVIRLAPDSQLERESLIRLRTTTTPRSSSVPGATSPAMSTPAAGIPAATATTPFTTDNAQGVGPVGVPLDLPVPKPPEPPVSVWKKLRQRPTTYFRGVPLAGATALSLLFLLWANNFAASRNLNQPPPVVAANPDEVPMPHPPGLPDTSAPRPGAVNPNAPAPAAPVAGTTTASTTAPASNNTVPVNPAGTAATPGSTPSTAPAESTPAADTGGSTAPATPVDDGGTLTTQPAPARPAPPQAATSSEVPSGIRDSGGASLRGGPLGPTGSPARAYDRVAPVGGPASRPENRATGEERAAGEEARSGRPDAAIARLSSAIENGGPDVALRFQQRAQLYWQGGDASRAISDFQSAISAYNDMIARNDRVAVARAGIAACRRGIQMAQARTP